MEKKKRTRTVIAIILFAVLLAGWCFIAVLHLNAVEQGFRGNATESKIVAHRGAAAHQFENTIEAFSYAAKSSYFQAVETDVRRTKDGVLVCSHDDNPFVDSSVSIAKSNYADIKDLPLDTGRKGEYVPETTYRLCAYEDFLKLMSTTTKTIFVELKIDFTGAQLKDLAEKTGNWIFASRIVYCGFDQRELEPLLKINRSYRIMAFTKGAGKAFFLNQYGYNIGFQQELLKKKPDYIDKLHEKNRFIAVYTVNDRAEIQYYKNLGVDYIITDYDFGAL